MSKTRDLADSAVIINYLDNVTSDVQSQLDAKISTSDTSVAKYADTTANFTGDLQINGASVATESYVAGEVSALVASAPATLDTLNELATALGNDADFATTVTTNLGLKANASDVNTSLALKVNVADIPASVGYLNIPPVGTKTGAYTLAKADVGKYVQLGTGASITIPNGVFAEGDVVSLFNNNAANITVTCSITTAYKAGDDGDNNSFAIKPRGIVSVLFLSASVCVFTGNIA